jgi:hypothetical protein
MNKYSKKHIIKLAKKHKKFLKNNNYIPTEGIPYTLGNSNRQFFRQFYDDKDSFKRALKRVFLDIRFSLQVYDVKKYKIKYRRLISNPFDYVYNNVWVKEINIELVKEAIYCE